MSKQIFNSESTEELLREKLDGARVVFEARYDNIERAFVKNPATKYSWIEVAWAYDLKTIESRGGISAYYCTNVDDLDNHGITQWKKGSRYVSRRSVNNIITTIEQDVLRRNGTTALVVCRDDGVVVFDNTYQWRIDEFLTALKNKVVEYLRSVNDSSFEPQVLRYLLKDEWCITGIGDFNE